MKKISAFLSIIGAALLLAACQIKVEVKPNSIIGDWDQKSLSYFMTSASGVQDTVSTSGEMSAVLQKYIKEAFGIESLSEELIESLDSIAEARFYPATYRLEFLKDGQLNTFKKAFLSWEKGGTWQYAQTGENLYVEDSVNGKYHAKMPVFNKMNMTLVSEEMTLGQALTLDKKLRPEEDGFFDDLGEKLGIIAVKILLRNYYIQQESTYRRVIN